MKVSNGTIWQAREPLQELAKQVLPIKTAYQLARLKRVLDSEVAIIEQVRNKLILEHGDRDEKGTPTISPMAPNWGAFAAAYNELMSQEAEIDRLKVKVVATDDLKLSAAALMALEDFVEIE